MSRHMSLTRSGCRFGSVAGAVTWIVVWVYLGGGPSVGDVPGFVWAILIVYATSPGLVAFEKMFMAWDLCARRYLIFFNTFPINMYMQYAKIGRCACLSCKQTT